MLPGVFVSLVLACVYALGIDGPWLWDDHMLIENSPVVTDGAPISRYFREPLWTVDTGTNTSLTFYRPLVVLSYRADWLLHHGNSAGFHLTNVCAFAACTLLAHAWLLRLKLPPLAAALTVAAWGASPRLVESVGWISGRTDLFAAMFALAALVAWPARGSSPRAFAIRLTGSGVLLFAGLLSKEVAFAAVIVLCASCFAESDRRRFGAGVATLAGVSALYFALRTSALAAGGSASLGTSFSLARSASALGTYVTMLADPRPASLHGSPDDATPWRVALGLSTALLALVGLARVRRRRQPLALLLLGGASLGPVLHLVPLRIDVLVADRYLFMPMLAAYALVAYEATRTLAGRPLRAAAGVGALFIVCELSPLVRRIDDHRDELRFWVEAERTRTTRSARPLVEVGRILFDARRFEDVSQLLTFAIRQGAFGVEELTVARHNLALALFALGRTAAASRTIERLVSEHAPGVATRLLEVDLALATSRFATAESILDDLRVRAPSSSLVAASRERVAEARRLANELAGVDARLPVDGLWLRARFAASFLGARTAEAAWSALAVHPEAPPEARIAAVQGLSEVGTPDALRSALASLVARDGESPFSRNASLVLADVEQKWTRGAEVMQGLSFAK